LGACQQQQQQPVAAAPAAEAGWPVSNLPLLKEVVVFGMDPLAAHDYAIQGNSQHQQQQQKQVQQQGIYAGGELVHDNKHVRLLLQTSGGR